MRDRLNFLSLPTWTFILSLAGSKSENISRLPLLPLPLFRVALHIHSPGKSAHVIKSLPCQLTHCFINIQMCYQTGTRSSWQSLETQIWLAAAYCSINYPAAGMLCSSEQCHASLSPSKSSEYIGPVIQLTRCLQWLIKCIWEVEGKGEVTLISSCQYSSRSCVFASSLLPVFAPCDDSASSIIVNVHHLPIQGPFDHQEKNVTELFWQNVEWLQWLPFANCRLFCMFNTTVFSCVVYRCGDVWN